MSKRKAPLRRDGEKGDYEVGYCRPPRHTQWGPGQSGNLRGRPKGLNNFSTDLQRVLKMPVKLNEGGRTRNVSSQQAGLMLLREKALQASLRHLERFLELAHRHNNEPAPVDAFEPMPAEDKAILAAYVARVTGRTASRTDGTAKEKTTRHQRAKKDDSK
jgi:hypothetical protein